MEIVQPAHTLSTGCHEGVGADAQTSLPAQKVSISVSPSSCNRETQISPVLSVCCSLLKIAMYFLNWDSCYRIVSFICNTLDKDQSSFHVFTFHSQGLTCSQTRTAMCFTHTSHMSLYVPGSDRAGSALLC